MHADHADRRLHHVDERLVDPFRLRAPGDTEAAGRCKIERQLLDRRIEWTGRSAPLRDPRANAVVERSDERRLGNAVVRPGRSRWCGHPKSKQTQYYT